MSLFRFADPQRFWWLVGWFALLAFWVISEARARRKLETFASGELLPTLLRGYSPKRRRTKFLIGFAAVFLAIVALARPQLGSHEEFVKSQGLDLVFLLDVSNSMLAEDVVPNRLKKAKHVIRNFVDKLSGDRAGIIAFAGSAYPAVPLTTDYEFLRQTLEVLDERSIANQGTDLAHALQVAVDLLDNGGVNGDGPDKETDENAGSRVIVLLSDGEDHEGEEAKLSATLKKKGIQVYSIGVGSLKGSPIPVRTDAGFMQGYRRDDSGNMILTKLETASLEAVASKTGGKFYSASSNEGEVQEILDTLNGLQRTEGGGRKIMVYDELFQYPLFAAIALLLLQLHYREVARRKKKDAARPGGPAMSATLALLLALGWMASSPRAEAAVSLREYSETKKGSQSYQDKDYTEAIDHFGKAQAENPDSSVGHFNLGDALLKGNNGAGAVSEFREAAKSPDGNFAAKSLYNMGKSFESQGDMEHAMQAYQEGLDRLMKTENPDSEVLQRIKRGLEVAQNQKNQSGQDQQKDKKQDQNQKDNKDQKNNNEEKKDQKYQTPKPQFKGEKMSESDARRILKQLQEQEKKTQQQMMRSKTGKPQGEKRGKDW